MEELIKFLKSKRLYTMYQRECKDAAWDDNCVEDEVDYLIMLGSPPSRILLASFNWRASTKGYDFWDKIYEEVYACVDYM